ncbi:MAG: hypothetical protein NVS4B11_07170 [Ktedonobacteraceae bacterium]
MASDSEAARQMAIVVHMAVFQRLMLDALSTKPSLLAAHLIPPKPLRQKERYR